MDLAAYVSLLIVLSYMLVRSADLVEDAFVLVAKKLGVSAFTIGFLILSFASSLPEASLMITSSLNNAAGLSVGNIVGGTIIMLTLVAAIDTYKSKSLPFQGRFGFKKVVLSLMIISLQPILILDGNLSVPEGIFAFASYSIFALYIIWDGNRKNTLHEHAKIEVGNLSILLAKSFVGILGLVLISRVLVEAAVETATLLSIPNSIVGLIVLAIGTNLPELTVAFRTVNKEQAKLAAGNLIGSSTVNTATLGLLAILSPTVIQGASSLIPSMIILSGALLLFGIFARSSNKISRKEGLVLFGLYILLVTAELLIIII